MLLLHEVAGINWQVINVVHDEGEALILYDTYKVKTTIIFDVFVLVNTTLTFGYVRVDIDFFTSYGYVPNAHYLAARVDKITQGLFH